MNAVKKSRANIRRMTQGETWRATRRLILLLRQLDQDGGGTRGTRAAIHRNTGLDQGVVSDLINGTGRRQNVTGQTIEKVLKLFRADTGQRLNRDFFFGSLPRGVDPNYRDYLITASPDPEPEKHDDGDDGDDDDDGDTYTEADMLEELQPTARELKQLKLQLRRFKYPRVDAYFKRAIIVAFRSGPRMQATIDEAVDRMGDAIAREDDEAASAPSSSQRTPPKRKKKSTY